MLGGWGQSVRVWQGQDSGGCPLAPSSSSDLNRVGADLGKVDLARVGAEEGGEGP